jgi:hypothetical protein
MFVPAEADILLDSLTELKMVKANTGWHAA